MISYFKAHSYRADRFVVAPGRHSGSDWSLPRLARIGGRYMNLELIWGHQKPLRTQGGFSASLVLEDCMSGSQMFIN
jgi:hypothetical protein